MGNFMKYFLSFLLTNILSCQPAHALNDVDKSQVWNKNLLANGGFESGKAKWTASAGTFTATASSPLIGLQHATWDAAASGNTLTSTAVTIPAGMYGRNMVASCLFTVASGTATTEIQAYDGSNVLAEASITSSTTPTRSSVNFIAPSSGSLSLRLYANADDSSVAIDDCYLGPAEGYNIGSAAQAVFIGSAYFATTTSCTFARTNTALGVPGDSDCPGPTVEVNPGPGTIQTTDTDNLQVTVNNLPPGRYRVVFMGTMGTGGTSSAIAINDGTNTYGQIAGGTTTSQTNYSVEANFEYSSAGNRTFSLYASSASGAVSFYNAVSNARTSFYIYRFPTSQEQTYTPDKLANSWSGYHAIGCIWDRTNTAMGDFTDDATSCTLTETLNRNFGTVSSVGSTSPAITFTPSRVGTYFVCVGGSIGTTATASVLDLQLTDGTTIISSTTNAPTDGSGATDRAPFTLCGTYAATSISAKTLKLQGSASTGVVRVAGGATTRSAIEWSIFQIDQSFPAPVLTPYNKYQIKYLSADVTADNSDITSLKFSNLTIGKRYRVSLRALCLAVNDSTCSVYVDHNGSVLTSAVQYQGSGGTDDWYPSLFAQTIFTAAATTVTFRFDEATDNTLYGNGTAGQTYTMLEELNNYTSTSEW